VSAFDSSKLNRDAALFPKRDHERAPSSEPRVPVLGRYLLLRRERWGAYDGRYQLGAGTATELMQARRQSLTQLSLCSVGFYGYPS
jgi:hypothetical protein